MKTFGRQLVINGEMGMSQFAWLVCVLTSVMDRTKGGYND